MGEILKAWPLVLSGVLLVLAWQMLALTGVMALGGPNVTPELERSVQISLLSLLIVPATWVLSVFLWRKERKREKSRLLYLVGFGIMPFASYLIPVVVAFLTGL